jgi:hypothetical protein
MNDIPNDDTIKILVAIAEIKKDISYIRTELQDIKSENIRRKNYFYAVIGAIIISITSIGITIFH